jgi:hypothetical protein
MLCLYITALVADVLELETTVLHVSDPTVGCICTPTMVAIPLFPYYHIYMWAIMVFLFRCLYFSFCTCRIICDCHVKTFKS